MAKNPPINFMIDIETLDTAEQAYVYEIGIVAFGAATVYEVLGEKHILVGKKGQEFRRISPDTLQWAMNTEGRMEALAKSMKAGLTVSEASAELKAFVEAQSKGHGMKTYWSKGNFDYPILKSLFAMETNPLTWQYYQVRELRTLLKFYTDELGLKIEENKNSHDALEDAKNQVDLLRKIALNTQLDT